MTRLDDDADAAALLHRLHIAGARFPWRGGADGRYVATGPLSDADLAELRRLRPAVLRLLDRADLVSRCGDSDTLNTTAGQDEPAEG